MKKQLRLNRLFLYHHLHRAVRCRMEMKLKAPAAFRTAMNLQRLRAARPWNRETVQNKIVQDRFILKL